MSTLPTDAAFPAVKVPNSFVWSEGFTKRELFAAMAMQGIIAANSLVNNKDAAVGLAVELADKLIEELNK